MIVLEFVGGPKDGERIAWNDAPVEFYVPAQPRLVPIDDNAERLVHEHYVYVRRELDRGVWKYDLLEGPS